MAVGIVLIARQNNDLAMSQLEKVIDVFSHTYLDTLTWYRKKKNRKQGAKKTYFDETTYGNLARFLKSLKNRQGMLDRWAPQDKKGRRHFDIEGRPDKLDKVSDEQRQAIHKAMAAYRKTLDASRAASFSR